VLALDPSNVLLIPEEDADRFDEIMNDWLTRALAPGGLFPQPFLFAIIT